MTADDPDSSFSLRRLKALDALDHRGTRVMISMAKDWQGPCSEGCPGWFVQSGFVGKLDGFGDVEWSEIARCDDCALFESDQDAALFAFETVFTLEHGSQACPSTQVYAAGPRNTQQKVIDMSFVYYIGIHRDSSPGTFDKRSDFFNTLELAKADRLWRKRHLHRRIFRVDGAGVQVVMAERRDVTEPAFMADGAKPIEHDHGFNSDS